MPTRSWTFRLSLIQPMTGRVYDLRVDYSRPPTGKIAENDVNWLREVAIVGGKSE